MNPATEYLIDEAIEEILTNDFEVDVDEQEAIRLLESGEATFEPEAAPNPANRFVVDTEEKANWALHKIRSALKKLGKVTEAADRERARIDEFEKHESLRHRREVQLFEAMLEDYHRRELAKDPKAKTIRLPAGELKSRKGQPKVEITDVDAFIAWAKEHRPEFVRVKTIEEPQKKAVNEAAVKDGEVLPHVEVAPAETSYSIEVTP